MHKCIRPGCGRGIIGGCLKTDVVCGCVRGWIRAGAGAALIAVLVLIRDNLDESL